MNALWDDIRHSARTLARTPGFTAIALLTLALGIGANSAIFSLVNAVLLRPLPYDSPGRLVVLHESREGRPSDGNVSGHEFAAWRARSAGVLAGAAMYGYEQFNITGSGDPETIRGLTVTANFFDVLGTRAALGRSFLPGEDAAGAEKVAVLSHHFWARRFGGDSSVVGRSIMLSDQAWLVIGVAPPAGDLDPDVWVPMDVAAEVQRVGKHSNTVIARLEPGITLDRAGVALNRVAAGLESEYPGANTGHRVHPVPLLDSVIGASRRPVLLALGAVAFVLLIACANVAHLLLTRGAARRQELAVRAAMGAGRSRLIAHLMVESLLLSVVGGALGLLIAAWVGDLLPAIRAVQIPRMNETGIDTTVVMATLIISLLTGVATGLIPALRASRLDLRSWLADGARSSMRSGRRLAEALVVSEIALALVLLVGAGLVIKSFTRLSRVDPGFVAANVLMVPIQLPANRYATPESRAAAFQRLHEGIAAIPGVRSVGATTEPPLGPCCNTYPVDIEGGTPPAPGDEHRALFRIASADYFRTLSIPLRRGRFFEATDARVALPLIRYWAQAPYPARFDEAQAGPVGVINETMARTYWPGAEAVGRRFRVIFSPWITVVGVVGDVRQQGLGALPGPEMFLSALQEPAPVMSLMVRADGEPATIAAAVRERVRAVDADLPVREVVTLESVVHDSLGRPRFNAMLLGVLAGLALTLALVGVYGVIAYSVEQRRHEIGVRTALGADARDVVRLILGRFMVLTSVGVGIGLVGAFALTRLLKGLLYDTKPTDPVTFVSLALIISVVAMIACYLPTRRATQVDPVEALRGQ